MRQSRSRPSFEDDAGEAARIGRVIGGDLARIARKQRDQPVGLRPAAMAVLVNRAIGEVKIIAAIGIDAACEPTSMTPLIV